ncbi:TrbG/VirB9 family P-type conjugative transfer protein [Thalassospira sp.]|uniref:TrbG/VirB9 family P-type conjugative transfer protein n=1 Tax=Thalassospira sp. TaxID=1912094 RepID=UPI002733B9B3|nr:TrbG/VirB9 family P-type conjugative transfer protein [Thalassospira sp.]MDP2699930.1 TrbG/VirB9 family P-type conjugative transfer protein [Thalassospira sp.]
MKIPTPLRIAIHVILFLCLLIFLGMAALDAMAQTPRPAMPGQEAPFAGGQSVQPPTASAQMPVPDSIVDQAKLQAEGEYGTLVRPRTSGQVQEVWDYASKEDGVYTTDMCADCTYRVRTREYLVTVIELPRGEVISAIDIGDKSNWTIAERGQRRIAVRPHGYGYDTSMAVYGASGAVYPIYLRAEGVNSTNLPDLVVRIAGVVQIDKSLSVPVSDATAAGTNVSDAVTATATVPKMKIDGEDQVADAVNGLTNTNPGTPEGDFVAEAKFDPNALRGWGQYKLWGDDDLEPVTVFRDDHFTYIRFGDKWKDLELPTAYVVVDEFDELVNTRVQGQTFIVESTQKLITLKSGFKYMCIEYTGGA